MEEFINPVPEDIKVILSNGKPTLLWVDEGRFAKNGHSRTIYAVNADGRSTRMLDDCLWTYKLTGRDPALILELRAAGKIEELLRVAQMFEVELPIARIDIYWYKGRFYGGEVTLTSGAFAQHCISASCARTAATCRRSLRSP